MEVRTVKKCEIVQNRFDYIDVYKNKFEISKEGKVSFSTTLWARNVDKILLSSSTLMENG